MVSLAGAALTAACTDVNGRSAEPSVTPERLRASTNIAGTTRASSVSKARRNLLETALRPAHRVNKQSSQRFQDIGNSYVSLRDPRRRGAIVVSQHRGFRTAGGSPDFDLGDTARQVRRGRAGPGEHVAVVEEHDDGLFVARDGAEDDLPDAHGPAHPARRAPGEE